MVDVLKPCPFCGGEDLKFSFSDIDGWAAQVLCTVCDDMVGPKSKFKYNDKFEAAEDATEVWNSRPLLEEFPQPNRRREGQEPCSECKIQDGETCDICGASSDAVAEREAEPVAWPRIMYVCEYCQEYNPEMCGHDRTDLYILPDGRWLCDGCIDDEGVSSSDCVSPPLLYTSPPTSELEALRKRVAELEGALEPFVKYTPDKCFKGSKRYKLVETAEAGGGWFGAEDFRTARRVREGGKVE